jgi:hypothetical protein
MFRINECAIHDRACDFKINWLTMPPFFSAPQTHTVIIYYLHLKKNKLHMQKNYIKIYLISCNLLSEIHRNKRMPGACFAKQLTITTKFQLIIKFFRINHSV